jgi:hypothetical protein
MVCWKLVQGVPAGYGEHGTITINTSRNGTTIFLKTLLKLLNSVLFKQVLIPNMQELVLQIFNRR